MLADLGVAQQHADEKLPQLPDKLPAAVDETHAHALLIGVDRLDEGLERHVAPRDERSAIYGERNNVNIQKLKDAGICACLSKPILNRNLAVAVRQALEQNNTMEP